MVKVAYVTFKLTEGQHAKCHPPDRNGVGTNFPRPFPSATHTMTKLQNILQSYKLSEFYIDGDEEKRGVITSATGQS